MALRKVNREGWTTSTLKQLMDERATQDREIERLRRECDNERDRRYTEVKNAEEKALKIKEEADKTALGLQRDVQTYKDEKANELREQINSERGLYATKEDLTSAIREMNTLIRPLTEYVSAHQGASTGLHDAGIYIALAISTLVGLIGLIFGLMRH
jgi:chromosome segregation ATPase